ncbi:MAG: hypothetical protein ACTHLV_01030, partial [Achromobacter mucicolens]
LGKLVQPASPMSAQQAARSARLGFMAFSLVRQTEPAAGRRKTGTILAGNYLPEPRRGAAIFSLAQCIAASPPHHPSGHAKPLSRW